MGFWRQYKHIVYLMLIAGAVFLAALRFSTVITFGSAVFDALIPLVWGVLMAFILQIIVKRFERIYFPTAVDGWKAASRRPVCIVLAIVAILLAIFFVARMAVPQLIASLGIVVKATPQIYHATEQWINTIIAENPDVLRPDIIHSISPNSVVTYISDLGAEGGKYVMHTMSSAVEMVFNFVVGLIFAIYILLDQERLRSQAKRIGKAYCSEKTTDRIGYVWQVTSQTFSSFFIGQFLDALILGIMVGIGLWLFGLSYALTIGCVVGLTALIPLLGAYLGGAIGIIMLLAVSPMQAALFVVILVVMQQIEGNVIYPRIVGGSVGLPGIWVFAAITIGGTLYGVPGILFSVPLAGTLYKLFMEDIGRRLERKL
ncbi:AI-2E family transporter [Veillonella magna]|uniref:AI-2E family transporter n=1 Tax=Veillonella magna TaxID=464322 RepID=UPI002585B783|nr:AI-2E family transporter [Veillonella magna]